MTRMHQLTNKNRLSVLTKSSAPLTPEALPVEETRPADRPYERRREPRFPANDPVQVCILEPRCERVSGTILDISRSGLRVQVPTPVAKTVHLEVIVPSQAIIFGETRYCRRQSGVYQVGVSIDDVYFAQPASAQHVDAHLLNSYILGKGLTLPEVIQIRRHLADCTECRSRLIGIHSPPRA